MSHDGLRLVYIHWDGLSIAASIGSGAKRVTSQTADDSAAWSPDDEWIVFDKGDSNIYVVRGGWNPAVGGRVSRRRLLP